MDSNGIIVIGVDAQVVWLEKKFVLVVFLFWGGRMKGSGMEQDLLRIANQRSRTHVGHASQRVLSEDYNIIGVAGEFAFAEKFNLQVDDSIKPSGDKGVDFILDLSFTVDVKTARLPYNLLLEVGKPVVDIYVLAAYKNGSSTLLGWEWGKNLSVAPKKDFGYGVINHYIAASNLRPIEELYERSQRK
jgi:hypothetical protein